MDVCELLFCRKFEAKVWEPTRWLLLSQLLPERIIRMLRLTGKGRITNNRISK